jgi:hypothetical protein
MAIYRSAPIVMRPPPAPFQRADLVFEGVEQAGPSFQARVFLNNPAADAATPLTAANGYAGAFHVYGSAGPGTEHDGQASAPITKYIVATDAVRAALEQSDLLLVNVVPVPTTIPLHFTRITVIFDPT